MYKRNSSICSLSPYTRIPLCIWALPRVRGARAGRHHIREYRYVYGAVDPMDAESFFLVMPYCNTECMQVFLNQLRSTFPDDIIVLVCDGAAWHKSGTLEVPEGISILHIPPYTPEMNPIEQIWRELRTRGFRNEVFATLEKVVDRLCKTINHLSRYTVMSITQRKWIKDIFILFFF